MIDFKTMSKKEKYAVLTPKTEEANKKLSYHGNRWLLKGEVESLKFSRTVGPFYLLISRDGKKCLHIQKTNDPDFIIYLE